MGTHTHTHTLEAGGGRESEKGREWQGIEGRQEVGGRMKEGGCGRGQREGRWGGRRWVEAGEAVVTLSSQLVAWFT